MDALFPFGFPGPTAMYLTFYIVTGVIYGVFMNYTLAGAILLAMGRLRPFLGSRWARPGLIEKVVGDWLPAMLGMAITTGVAPLLFLQILHKQSFYTANLLLFHRFMLFLPALIVAYYMLYLLKSKRLDVWGPWPPASALTIVVLCFIFVAWAWTENHLLSLHHELWGEFYGSGRWFYADAELWPRLGFTVTVSFATLALVVAWQFVWGRGGHETSSLDLAARQLRLLAVVALATSAAEAVLWFLWLDTPARAALRSSLAMPYAALALVGITLQAACWLPVKSGADLTAKRLGLATAGAVAMLVGAGVAREARRLAAVDLGSLLESHRHAAAVGGITLFLACFLLNAGVIGYCAWLIKRDIAMARPSRVN